MSFSHRILLLGGTAGTGRQVVSRALERGHAVTAIARRPERLAIRHPRLTVVAADLAADPAAFDRTLPGHDVVLSALGRGRSLRSEGLMARTTPPLLLAMARQGVGRLVFLSAYGVGGSAPDAALGFRLMFRLMLRDIYADKARAEALIQNSGLDWTILAPVILTDGPATGSYRMGEHLAVKGMARIARADVADAMLRCLDDTTSHRKRYVVAP